MNALKIVVAILTTLAGLGCPTQSSAARQATLKWLPVTTYTNGQPVSTQAVYRVYKSTNGTSYVMVQTLNLTATTWVDGTVLPNHRYWYYVTAYEPKDGRESVPSTKVSITVGP